MLASHSETVSVNMGHWKVNQESMLGCRGRRHTETGGRGDEDSAIQEKCYAPRFLQVPADLSVEEGRFCRIDFKVDHMSSVRGFHPPLSLQ